MTRLTRGDFIRLGAVAAVPSWLAACRGEPENAVNFFNWPKYIGDDTLPRFTRETGIKVRYEEFADEEEMFVKLRAGAQGYDLIVAGDYLIPRLREMKIIEAFPPGSRKNIANVDAAFRDPLYDRGNAYANPYLWGTTGIAFNKARIVQPPDSWRSLWDPRYAGRISMLDNARDVIGVALLLLGLPETARDEKTFAAVKELLLKQRPLVRQYTNAAYIDSLVAGEVHLAMAWSGDALQAARENPDIDYIVPREGSTMYVDNVCLLRTAPNRGNALRLADYLLEGQVAAGIANTVRYASPNAAALPFLDKALLADTRVFPTRATRRRLTLHAPLDEQATALWNRAWSDIKVG